MTNGTITSISLNDVRKLIDDKDVGDTVADAVDQLLGLVLALSPLYAGSAAPIIMTLIEPKNELIANFRSAVKKLSKSEPSDYLDRAQRMAAANCLLTHVAFFDAFRQVWPSAVRELGLTEEAAREALPKAMECASSRLGGSAGASLADLAVVIPHPIDRGVPAAKARLFNYREMSSYIDRCLGYLQPSVLTNESRKPARDLVLSELPALAESLYQAEYLGMAAEFEQFFVWTMLHDHAALEGRVQDLAGDERIRFELIGRAIHCLDLGLQDLATAIAHLPRSALARAAHQDFEAVAKRLHLTYAASLQRQVVDDQFPVDDRPRLNFPKKIDAFVPQAYRVVRHEDKKRNLGREDQWLQCEVHDGIGEFIMRYLESPYSVQMPLLILGHPGSGKSLLTEMLAGHLAYPTYTTVRVKLRDVNPDTDFLTQLEEQIRLDTGGHRVSWADFAASLNMAPPVIILDGYDELLQATGQVFASYLDKVRQFQHDQAVQRRPARVIVTSRVTLIDRAQIPPGTTVMRLEEFDESRRAAWVNVWNRHNAAYFQQSATRLFAVPDSEKILELAHQPLLLLMLAIYDSDRNELSARPDIDRTLLYDRLLRRFIERELSKGEDDWDFQALPEEERQAAIDWEMNRLGVVAIGMFNRQEVKISRDQLDADLRYFDAEKKELPDGRRLQQADLVLGSFFFVHESRTRLTAGAGESTAGPAAFEFLHNTFGEFLTADFILRRALAEALTIGRLSGDPMMADTRRLRLATHSRDWIGCLVHTALHTRPVILSMIREWSRHQMGNEQSQADLLAALDAIVAAQLSAVLTDVTIPDPTPRPPVESPYTALPRRGQVAVYSLNLVLLRLYISDSDYALQEDQLGAQATGCRPWDSLIALWHSWFPVDAMALLADLMMTTRRDGLITVTRNRKGFPGPASSPLRISCAAAMAVGDGQLAAMAGLHQMTLYGQRARTYGVFRDFIQTEMPELMPSISLLELKRAAPNGDSIPEQLYRLGINLDAGRRGVDVADVAARLTRTPRQWARAIVGKPTLFEISQLSRYEAEAAVESLARLDPRWLTYLLLMTYDRTEGSAGLWREFLQQPAAAPVLRAAAREFSAAEGLICASMARRALNDSEFTIHDIDTAAALATLAFRGGEKTFGAQLLNAIIRKCERGEWILLDIPVEAWEGLAGLIRSERYKVSAAFMARVDDAVEASLREYDLHRNSFHQVAQFWVQALRIGATRYADRILESMDNWLAVWMRLGAGRKPAMSFIGLAHENNDPSLMTRAGIRDASESWLDVLLGRSALECPPEAVDEIAIERNLTYKEAMDLKWALGVLQQADGSSFESC